MSLKKWLHGLGAAIIGGVTSAISAMFVDPAAFNFGDFPKLGKLAAGSALLSAVLYLKQSPLPADDEPEAKAKLPSILLLIGLSIGLTGCISVHQSEITKDGVRKDFHSTAILSASAVKGLNANSTTGTTSTGVKMESAESRADAEAIKAMGEAFGAAVGEGLKKSVKP